MPALSEYVNVYSSALRILTDKGYQVWYNDKSELYCAEKGGWDFMAENPISLLGLVAIYESQTPQGYSEYWWRREGPHHTDLPRSPQVYTSVVARKGR